MDNASLLLFRIGLGLGSLSFPIKPCLFSFTALFLCLKAVIVLFEHFFDSFHDLFFLEGKHEEDQYEK